MNYLNNNMYLGFVQIELLFQMLYSIITLLLSKVKIDHYYFINTASSEKGTTLKVANSEFQFFGYYVMGPYE